MRQSIGTAKILSRCGSFGRACFNVGNASNGLANSPSAWSRETTNALGNSPRISAWSSSVSEPSSWMTSCSFSWLVARRLLRQITAMETSRWQTRLWTSSFYAPEVTRSFSSSSLTVSYGIGCGLLSVGNLGRNRSNTGRHNACTNRCTARMGDGLR